MPITDSLARVLPQTTDERNANRALKLNRTEAPVREPEPCFPDEDIAQMQALLSVFSTNSFMDRVWNIQIATSGKQGDISFPDGFSALNTQALKAAVLTALSNNASMDEAKKIVREGRAFLEFLAKKRIPLSNCRTAIFNKYVDELKADDTISVGVKNNRLRVAQMLIEVCLVHGLLHTLTNIDCTFRFRESRSPKRAPDACVIDALDRIFFDLDQPIPTAYRCIYILLRMISNRISEVLSMNTECISYPEDDVFAISIPTSKETPYHTPEYNTYNRKFSGYCEGILYESLREQQNEVRKIAPNQGYLFAGAYGTMVTAESFNRYLQTVIDNHNIVDSSGQPAHITSHNFRHIDISERLRSGVISDAQTMKESNHSSLRQTYEYGYQSLHDESKRLGEITEKVFRDKYGFENDTSQNTQPKEVVKRKYNRMLEMPQTRIIPAYGICCNPACTPRFERCIQCGNFDPDPVFYDYFEAAIKRLEDRIAMLEQKRGDPKVIASCRSQLGIYQMFIEKIKTERRAFV